MCQGQGYACWKPHAYAYAKPLAYANAYAYAKPLWCFQHHKYTRIKHPVEIACEGSIGKKSRTPHSNRITSNNMKSNRTSHKTTKPVGEVGRDYHSAQTSLHASCYDSDKTHWGGGCFPESKDERATTSLCKFVSDRSSIRQGCKMRKGRGEEGDWWWWEPGIGCGEAWETTHCNRQGGEGGHLEPTVCNF